MSLYNQFKTNSDYEKDGIWLEYSVDEKGKSTRIKIARAGGTNIKYAKILETKFKPYRRALQTETLDNATADKLLREVFAESIVLDWENVTDENGKKLAFSKENVIKVLEDLPELWADIREQANKMVLFRQEAQEIAAKN